MSWRRSSTNYMGPHALAKLISQIPTIRTWRSGKRQMHYQHISLTVQDLPIIPRIEQLFFRIASNQHSKESKVLWSFRTMCCSLELPRSSSMRECLQSRDNYVRKTLLLMRNNLTQNQSVALVFLGYSISKKEKASDPNDVQKMKKCKSTN